MSPPSRAAPAALLAGVFGAALLFDLLAHAQSVPGLLAGHLPDPDSYVRLIRIRDFLRLGHFTDMLAGNASGAGTEIYWSHLLDAAILLLMAPLRLVMAPETALYWAGVATGPVATGALAAACAWAVAPLCARGWLWTAPLAAVLAPAVFAYGAPGNAHHHVPMAVIAVMTVGLAGRGAAGRAGLAAGLGIWLSPETLPFAAIAGGALALRWAGNDCARGCPARFGAACLAVVALALAIDPPLNGPAVVAFDRVSVAFLVLAAFVAAAGAGLWAASPFCRAPRARLAAAALLPALAPGAWLLLFPGVLRGTAALMTPEQASAFFGGISEMAPVGGAADLCLYLFAPVLAALLVGIRAWRRRSLELTYAAVCIAALTCLGRQHIRFALYPELAAAMALPVALSRVTAALAGCPPALGSLARVGVLALFLLVPLAPSWLAAPARAADPVGGPPCALGEVIPRLAPFAGTVVLASPNDAPELLYRTGLRTVGALYHRGIEGFMRLRAAWRSAPSPTLPPEVAATGAAYLLFCRAPERSPLVADLPAHTLLDGLRRGEVPPWLSAVEGVSGGGYRLYRIEAVPAP